MKKVGIVYHPLNKKATSLSQELSDFLSSNNIDCWLCSAWKGIQLSQQVLDTELILTIGGDGTILRTAQVLARHSIPLIGINMGQLGFLTELTADEVMVKLPALLAGEGWVDERAMLEVEVNNKEKQTNNRFFVLNDVVIARGEIARIIHVEAKVDDELLTTYKSDGIITATATGSTGYALACGGPVLHPQTKQFLLVPIVPHLSFDKTIVLPPQAEVKLRIGAIHKAVLSVDGHISLSLVGTDIIKIKHSPRKTRFLRTKPAVSFYSILEHKLKG
jgi:NAD+ kinase